MQKERSYYEEIKAQKDIYGQWIEKNEGFAELSLPEEKEAWGKLECEAKKSGIQIIIYDTYTKETVFEKEKLLFIAREGIPSKILLSAIDEAFKIPHVQIVYGDEDEISEEKKRHAPWFKPDYAPNTLESYFYIGSAFAIRRELIKRLYAENIWELFFQAVKQLELRQTDLRKSVFHSDAIWFHRNRKAQKWENYSCNKEHALLNTWEDMVSIIIPSKDNPSVLEKCVCSLLENTQYSNYEIIVVDNGSNSGNKKEIEMMKIKYKFNYIYNFMEFNFSAMCNIGVQYAKGKYVLLLNDDMEIIQKDWLTLLHCEAKKENVGAVGAKLLYPNSDIIQHVGVTNLEIGPAHKLVTVADKGEIYHGANTRVINMLAVTAACLLISKEKYQRVGGLCEELKVAYNDVDFCFSLYEMGLYNVQHNGVVLYHHESLSRGDDITTKEKYDRLLGEKDKLYERHPELYKKDPFYSKNLTTNSPYYTCNFLYPFEDKTYFVEADKKNCKRFLKGTFLKIHYHIDHAELEQKMETKDLEHYFIDGWSFVNKEDNAKFNTYLLLENEKKRYWRFPVLRRYREDVMPVAANQVNAELSGFALRFKKDEIPKGKYNIILLKKHIPTGSNHYCKTDMSLIAD